MTFVCFLWYVGGWIWDQRHCFRFGSWRAKFLEKAEMNEVTAFLNIVIYKVAKLSRGYESQSITSDVQELSHTYYFT